MSTGEGIDAPARERLDEGVRAYLADCREHRPLFSPAYHPTADGAAKAVYCASKEETAYVKARFRELTGKETG